MRVRTSVAISLSVLVLLFASSVYVTPIHLTLYHAAEDSPSLLLNNKKARTAQRPAQTEQQVTIQNVSREPKSVQMTLPAIYERGPQLLPSDFPSIHGDWHEGKTPGQLVSFAPGSTLEFHSIVGDLTISFVTGPNEGMVRVTSGTHHEERDLSNPTPGTQDIVIHAPQRATVTSTLFRFRPIAVALAPLERAARLDVTVANMPLLSMDVPPRAPFNAQIATQQVWKQIQHQHCAGLQLVGIGLLCAVALCLFGYLILYARSTPSYTLSDVVALGTSAALAFFGIVASSLSYAYDGHTVALFMEVLMLNAIIVALILLIRRSVRWTTSSLNITHGDIFVFTSIFASLFLAYWPAFHVGEWFHGLLHTDAAFNVNITTIIRNHSFYAMRASHNSLNGFGMRVIDFVTAGQLAEIFSAKSRTALLVTAMLTHCLTVLLSYVTARRLIGPTRNDMWAAVFAGIVAFWAPYAGIYMEAYFSQYILTFGLYFSFAAGVYFLQEIQSRDHVFTLAPDVRLVSLATVFCIVLYPYFSFVPVAVMGTVLWQSGRRIFAHAWRLFAFVAACLLIANINLFIILDAGQTAQYTDALNTIARNVVFPFYHSKQFLSILLGATPFHVHNGLVTSYAHEFSDGGKLFRLLGIYLRAVNSHAFLIGFACLFFGAYVWAIKWTSIIRSNLLQWTVAILYLLMIALMGFTSQTYAFAKLCWTFSTLFPLVFLLPLLSSLQKMPPDAHHWGKNIALLCIVIFASTNMVAITANNLEWFGNISGVANRRPTALLKDMNGIENALDNYISQGNLPLSVSFMGPGPMIRSTSKDAVILGFMQAMFQQKHIDCPNCVSSALSMATTACRSEEACQSKGNLIVTMATFPRPQCAAELPLYQGEHLSFYQTKP